MTPFTFGCLLMVVVYTAAAPNKPIQESLFDEADKKEMKEDDNAKVCFIV